MAKKRILDAKKTPKVKTIPWPWKHELISEEESFPLIALGRLDRGDIFKFQKCKGRVVSRNPFDPNLGVPFSPYVRIINRTADPSVRSGVWAGNVLVKPIKRLIKKKKLNEDD